MSTVLSAAAFNWLVPPLPVACFSGIASSLKFTKLACRSWLVVEVVFLTVVRVGEASYPGPADAVSVQGFANPTRLRCNTMFGAIHMVPGEYVDCWMAKVSSTPVCEQTRELDRCFGQARQWFRRSAVKGLPSFD